MVNDALWHVRMLGGLSLHRGGHAIYSRSNHKVGLLLAYLLLDSRCASPRDALIERFWPDADLRRGRQNLRALLSNLRDLLEPAGVPARRVLVADRTTVRLVADAFSTDVKEFQDRLRAAGRAAEARERAGCLAEAVDLYAGDLLAGFDEDWIEPERIRLADAYLAALDTLTTELASLGDTVRALHYAHLASRADPLDERRATMLIRLQMRAGHWAEAARQYARTVRRVQRDLGVDPNEDLARLGTQLRAGPRRPSASAARALEPPPVPPLPASPEGEDPRPAGLPRSTTAFVGREEEIALLRAWLLAEDPAGGPLPLVTLIGTGGAGKTRLALEIGRLFQQELGAPAWLAPLADLQDASQIPGRVADVLGVRLRSGKAPLGQLATSLSDRFGLLILDGLEHLGSPGAMLVHDLRERLHGLRVLATSRRRLSVPGEHVLPVHPLATPPRVSSAEQASRLPAVALFVQQARLADPDFRLTDANAADVALLCHRLDGLPLAIEMAASRICLFAPRQMLTRLARRFDLLRAGRTEGDPRHVSLWDACDWSYRLLSPPHQRLFARLSVFRGGFTLDAVEDVCCGIGPRHPSPADAADGLLSLYACSLVAADDDGGDRRRFRLLDNLREFASEHLEGDERQALSLRHAQHYAAWAAAARERAADDAAFNHEVDTEIGNLRQAMSYAQVTDHHQLLADLTSLLIDYWTTHGYAREMYRWVEPPLRKPEALGPQVRPPLLYVAGLAAQSMGDSQAARQYLARWADEVPATGQGLAQSLALQASSAFMAADYQEAHDLFVRAIAISRAASPGTPPATLLGHLGEVCLALGHHDEAAACYEECMTAEGKVQLQPYTLCQTAGFLLRHGRLQEARSRFEAALTDYARAGDRMGVAICHRGLGVVAMERLEVDAARAHLEESISLWRDSDPGCGGVADVLGCMASLASRLGDTAEAVRLYGESLALWRQHGHPRWIALTLGRLASAHVDAGRMDLARSLCEEAQGLVAGEGSDAVLHRASHVLGRIALQEGAAFEAAGHMAAALRPRLAASLACRVVESLEHGAAVLAAGDRSEEAAYAWFAADGLRSTLGAPRPPRDQAHASQLVEQLYALLGPAGMEAAAVEAAQVPWQHAAERVLASLESLARAE